MSETLKMLSDFLKLNLSTSIDIINEETKQQNRFPVYYYSLELPLKVDLSRNQTIESEIKSLILKLSDDIRKEDIK